MWATISTPEWAVENLNFEAWRSRKAKNIGLNAVIDDFGEIVPFHSMDEGDPAKFKESKLGTDMQNIAAQLLQMCANRKDKEGKPYHKNLMTIIFLTTHTELALRTGLKHVFERIIASQSAVLESEHGSKQQTLRVEKDSMLRVDFEEELLKGQSNIMRPE